ncbi:hypothetical protein DYU11_29670 [Fibrisoma montanum]|uniref:Uncharacterized protein n=1 Tax=Fibrisoma montanum TaxID=2305895 RepID=A0A418LXZ5_9BACT|nr:hypothetical protein [Fibrisoma montanum]RIV18126.1 hypothetical protein DYU11_29670 [Fibrisoma montanum]
MFTALYELFIGKNPDPTYRNAVFTSVGTLTLLIMLVLAALFYLLLGRWRAVFHRTSHWILSLVIALIIGFSLAISYAKDATGEPSADSYMYGFAGVNLLWALIVFVGASALFRRGSVYARHTPF